MPVLGLDVPKKDIDALFDEWDPGERESHLGNLRKAYPLSPYPLSVYRLSPYLLMYAHACASVSRVHAYGVYDYCVSDPLRVCFVSACPSILPAGWPTSCLHATAMVYMSRWVWKHQLQGATKDSPFSEQCGPRHSSGALIILLTRWCTSPLVQSAAL